MPVRERLRRGWPSYLMRGTGMRIDIAQLLRDPVGTQVDIEVDLGVCCLEDDLCVRAIRGQLKLVRVGEGIWVGGVLAVDLELACVRCLSPTVETIQVELDERFQLPPVDQSQDDGVFPIGADHHIDLGPVLRELIIVATPMHAICREDCLGLCPECGQNLNMGPCDCQPDDIDPRLAVLKALLSDGVET
jgi:uncharacterized protein